VGLALRSGRGNKYGVVFKGGVGYGRDEDYRLISSKNEDRVNIRVKN